MFQPPDSVIKVENLIDNPNFNINDYVGYVYITYHILTNRKYVGKKAFFHTTTKKLGKKELTEIPVTRGKRPTKKTVVKESDWKTYYGSATEIKSYKPEEMARYVLRLCKTKKELTYWETKYLFQYNVLEDNCFINDNILGRFYSKDVITAE
jgi:hypothetical protein